MRSRWSLDAEWLLDLARDAETMARMADRPSADGGPGGAGVEAEEAEQAGRSARDVRITHPGVGEWAGTSWLDACADSVDLTKFGELVADIARRLGEAGDPDTLEQGGP